MEHLLSTKLYIPPHRSQLVLRSRLLQTLDESRHRKLTIVSAPAGFGKTTLVSEWIASSKLPAAWLSLDTGDNDLGRFLAYFIAAMQTINSSIGEKWAGLLKSPQQPSAEIILTSLMNDVTSIEEEIILVLDDFHLIDSKPIGQAINFLVEHLPPQLHLVITTREDPDLPLARLRAKSQLTELRAADLRFTIPETAEFLNKAMSLNLSMEDIAALESRTEGWAAGLQLAAISLKGVQDTASFIESFTGSHHFVMDYLLEEVLEQQPENIQAFLLETSILDRLSSSLCDAVIPDHSASSAETLAYLERANLFVVPLDHERRWFRYHNLFRDLLSQRFMQKASPEEIAQVHIRANEWLEANGDIERAFHHAISAPDFDRAARLAESSWQTMDESFQMGTWLRWVNQLPSGVIRVRPVLCTQMGLAYLDVGNVDASESSLRDAEQSLNLPSSEIIVVEKGQFQTLPARIAFARAYNAQTQHRFSDVVKYAEMTLELLSNNVDDFLNVQVSTVLIGTHLANGNLDDACKLVDDFVEASKRAGKLLFAIAAAFGKADILIAQGKLRDALQTYQQALELADAHNAAEHTAHHHLGLGILYHEMGDDERAAQHLYKGFELGGQATILDWAYRKSLVQAHLKESEGDLEGALDLLDEAQRLYVRTPSPNLRPVDASKALIYLKQGKMSKAQEWAQKSGLSLQDAPDYLHEFERITLAWIRLAEHQKNQNEELFTEVLGLLERQLRLAEEQNRLLGRIEILILLALALHSKGKTSKALDSLEQALTLAEPEGFVRIFATEGKPMVELLSKLKDGRQKPYIDRIVSVIEQTKGIQSSSRTKQPLIEPLSDRELEVLRLIAQGLSNQEITQKLFVALSTVKGHNLRIFTKLGAKSRTEAVARARELGFL